MIANRTCMIDEGMQKGFVKLRFASFSLVLLAAPPGRAPRSRLDKPE